MIWPTFINVKFGLFSPILHYSSRKRQSEIKMVTVTKSKHKHHSFSIDIRDICHVKINCQKFKPKTDGATWKAGFGSYGLHGLVLRIYVTVICYSYRKKKRIIRLPIHFVKMGIITGFQFSTRLPTLTRWPWGLNPSIPCHRFILWPITAQKHDADNAQIVESEQLLWQQLLSHSSAPQRYHIWILALLCL